MDFKPCKANFKTEGERLLNYQHQHRGVRFIKLYLPPTIDREVNLVGQDDHIYRGRIPKLSEDKIPPEIDESSLDEVKLYQEIKGMDFPPVPPKERLEKNRIEGSYTLRKRLILAPIKVHTDEDLEEYQILGRDGGIYKGKGRQASQSELDKQLRGTKRSIHKKHHQSTSAGTIEPTMVTLQGINRISGGTATTVAIPTANVREITAIIKQQNNKTSSDKKQRKRKTATGATTDATMKDKQIELQETVETKDSKEQEKGEVQVAEEDQDAETEDIEIPQELEDTEETDEKEDSNEQLGQDLDEPESTDDEENTEDADEAEEGADTAEDDETEDSKDTDETTESPEQEIGGSEEED